MEFERAVEALRVLGCRRATHAEPGESSGEVETDQNDGCAQDKTGGAGDVHGAQPYRNVVGTWH